MAATAPTPLWTFRNAFNAVFVLLCFFMLFALAPDNTILQHDKDAQRIKEIMRPVLATEVNTTMFRNPVLLKIKASDLPTVLKSFHSENLEKEMKNDHTVQRYINNFVLQDMTGKKECAKISYFQMNAQARVTPLHKTMILMGCYGYPWKIQDKNPLPYDTKPTLDFMSADPFVVANGWAVNLLLHALEITHARNDHDMSMCSCMKDFASPSLGKDRLPKTKDDVQCTDMSAMHDTCTMQRAIDYTMQGGSNSTSTVNGAQAKMVALITASTDTTPTTRHRYQIDPMLELINTYATSKAADVTAGKLLNDLPLLKTFVLHLCEISTEMCEFGPTKTMIIGTTPLATVFTHMKTWPAQMAAHNKIMNPQFWFQGPPPICDKAGPFPITASAGAVSQENYQTYTHKYRTVFQTCPSSGVPHYTSTTLSVVKTAGVYNMGHSLLLFAAVFAFFWTNCAHFYFSRVRGQIIDGKNEAASSRDAGIGWTGVAFLLVVTVFVYVFYYLGNYMTFEKWKYQFTDDQMLDGIVEFNYFIFMWGLFPVVMMLIIFYLAYLVVQQFMKDAVEMKANTAEVVGETVKPTDDGEGLVETKRMFMNTMSSRLYTHPTFKTGFGGQEEFQKIDREHDVVNLNKITEKLYSVAMPAQVCNDICLVVALTVLADACIIQRGVHEGNVLLVVSVWFTTIGLLAHLSNVLRLTHVMTQHDDDAAETRHVQVVGHHRILLALIIAGMLFVYLNLAGIDGQSVPSTHTGLHMTLFVLCAFVCLCGADIILEFVVKKPGETTLQARFTHFWDHVISKAHVTSWILLLVVIFLHFHRATAVCHALKVANYKDYTNWKCFMNWREE